MKRIIMSLIDSTHTEVSKRDWKDIKLPREVITGRIKGKGFSIIRREFHFKCITLTILFI